MIIKSQCGKKIVANADVIKIEDHNSNKGGYIYINGELMAYYQEDEILQKEIDSLYEDLKHGVRYYEFTKNKKALQMQDQPTNNIVSL